MLSDAEFSHLAHEVKSRSGAVLTRELAGAILLRLQPLARREGFQSPQDLIAAARVREDQTLWGSITDQLAQSETRFFRDRVVFKKLRDQFIPAAIEQRPQERIRIWSAATSTGQEAYSIAMIVAAMKDEGLNIPIDIVGTDMSARLLEKARAGLYSQFEVQRGLPIRDLITHFERAGDLWRISDRMRASVHFEAFNLLKHPQQLGQFDIVVLAHVLHAFDAEAQQALLGRIAEVLTPGGIIVLGAGETPPLSAGLTFAHGVLSRNGSARFAA